MLDLEHRATALADMPALWQLNDARQEYPSVAETSARGYCLEIQRKLYDDGDKVARLLAWLSHKEEEAKWVREIITPVGGRRYPPAGTLPKNLLVTNMDCTRTLIGV
ncbi:hypothetical protein NDU88_007818 [Pleurodeles waltl]|uniref:Uncharacterized protein n=1 Tax=Pleurodeles waltl TaxID=8319 RepID=A0AAV7U3H4_PLEWA|nr:hypothetical protein NDU88_007818 [Pleurodeles waltl]